MSASQQREAEMTRDGFPILEWNTWPGATGNVYVGEWGCGNAVVYSGDAHWIETYKAFA